MIGERTEGPWEELGHNVRIRRVAFDGVMVGIDMDHPCRSKAYDWIPLAGRSLDTGHSWTLASDRPLTLTPSLLCRACGHHGFITDGKWVPA